jgi:aldehyde dehydrogenase (NAD+)
MNDASRSTLENTFYLQKSRARTLKKTRSAERIQRLKQLKDSIQNRFPAIKNALLKDLRKSGTESDLTEILPTLAELDFAIRNLSKWTQSRKVGTPLTLLGSRSEIRFEPKGTVLIIGPWNYPFQLMMIPLISAIAAGNCCILKPSELAPAVSSVLTELIASTFEPHEIACFEGDAEISQSLLKLPFDHIFFTGSGRLGKVVMNAAANHLSSVTLELGGKSPAIIDSSANLKKAAQSIIWGKFVNAGQTCVAPDYVFVHRDHLSKFIDEARFSVQSLYGPTEEKRASSQDFGRIVNSAHFQRLKRLLEDSQQEGAQIEMGGILDENDFYISPTLLSHIRPGSTIMKDEIFGPLLPILTYTSLDEVYNHIESYGRPLAQYIFSENGKRIEEILKNTTSGGTAINTTLVHLMNPHLPFGGVGASGMGNYHGFYGFKTFSHERSVLRQGRFNPTRFLYPPYRKTTQRIMNLILKLFG